MASGELKLKHKEQLRNVRRFQQLIFASHVSFSKHENAEKLAKLHYFLHQAIFPKPFRSGLNCLLCNQGALWTEFSADQDFPQERQRFQTPRAQLKHIKSIVPSIETDEYWLLLHFVKCQENNLASSLSFPQPQQRGQKSTKPHSETVKRTRAHSVKFRISGGSSHAMRTLHFTMGMVILLRKVRGN